MAVDLRGYFSVNTTLINGENTNLAIGAEKIIRVFSLNGRIGAENGIRREITLPEREASQVGRWANVTGRGLGRDLGV